MPSQMLAGAGDAEHLVSQEPFDQKQRLNVFRPVAALAARGSVRVQELGEFLLPVAEGMHFNTGDNACRANRNGSFRFGLFSKLHA